MLTTGKWRCFIVRVYVPPNNTPTVARVEKSLGQASKGVEVILMGNLNVRLQELSDVREEELMPMVLDCGLEDMTAQFMPRMRYRGDRR